MVSLPSPYQPVAGLAGADITVVGADIRLLRLPVANPLVAAHSKDRSPGRHPVRDLAVVGLVGAAAGRSVESWGECSALTTAGYWPETAESSFGLVAEAAGEWPGRQPFELVDSPGFDPVRFPMARAAVEMAAIDLTLTSAGVPLAAHLGVAGSRVPAGATVGLGAVDDVVDTVAALYDEGFSRVKVKIEPGHDREPVLAITSRLRSEVDTGALHLHVDGNGSYRPQSQHHETMLALADAGVTAFEQPFPVDRPSAGRRLCQALDRAGHTARVLIDEQADTVENAMRAVEQGHAHGVVVKPARLGGLAPSLDLLDRLAAMDAVVAVGGMLESGLGRHSLAAISALANHTNTTVVGDLSPARRWLADDPWADVTMSVVDGVAHVTTLDEPGVAPPPERDTLDRHTIRRVTVGASPTSP